MGKTRITRKPDASDDSISITSTVASATNDEYEVECILAERKSRGVIEYLTAWKDYPETAHLWLHRDNFLVAKDVFNDWTDTKKRIANGLQKPFDIKAWMKRCKAITREAQSRKERRRAKRLRLQRQDKLAASSREQDEKIQSSGSETAPKHFDKRIKRRNVHQDSPPSSSASAPISSSFSEDSDRPLVSRQESEIFAPNLKWTQAETIALEEGLRTLKGPRWRELLSLYGRSGKINQVLKDKNAGDLYDKAKSICQEFIDSGRDPPEYLEALSKAASSQASRVPTPTLHSESIGQNRVDSGKNSRSTSADSLMEELHEKQRIREPRQRENNQPQQKTDATEILSPARGLENESNTAEKISGYELKPHQASEAPVRRVPLDFAHETLNETPQATIFGTHPQTAIREGKVSEYEEPHEGEQPEEGPRARDLSQVSGTPQVEYQAEKQAPCAKEAAESAADAIALPEVSRNDEAMSRDTARASWSGTARAPTARPSLPDPSQSEAVGSGTTRPTSLKLKPKLGQIEPKKPSGTGDISAAWNTQPKKRMSNNWATKNVDPTDGQPKKRAYKLSVQNRIFKSRRDGRPPDPNCLVFIDPKTGKAPTKVPAPSATAIPSKTPLQLHQEELAAREAEERRISEVEDATVINRSESDRQQVMEHSSEITAEEHNEPNRSGSIINTSESVPKPITGDLTDSPADIGTLTLPSPAHPDPDVPINERLEQRAETKGFAKISLQDYTNRSLPLTYPLNGAVVDSHRSHSSNDPSKFDLRAYPLLEHKNELFQRPDSNVVIGDIKFGVDDREGIKVKFVGIGFEVKKLLLTIKVPPRTVDFVFSSACLASEYRAYFSGEPSDYLGLGSIVPYTESASAFEDVTETLANHLQGGLFFAQHFTMLVYPAGASAWAFLDKDLPPVHPGTALRFAVRKPLPPVRADSDGPAIARLRKDKPERYEEIKAKIQKQPKAAEEKNINSVFWDMFEIDFGRLVAQNGPQQHSPTNVFFLCFIPQGCENYEPDLAKRSTLRMRTSEEHDSFIEFLQANGAEEVYSMQNIGSQEFENNGAWDYFCKNFKSGTIIFHDAFIRYDLVPRLAKHLLHGSVNVWKTSLSPMHPGEKHPHLVRLFPHGGVLLLTESLILYRSRECLRVLMWFRRVHVPGKTPGTWKLAVRPRIREWLLDIIEAYSDSGKDIFGCGIQVFADIYTEIYWLLQNPDPSVSGLMCHEWDYETPTDEAPIVSSSSLRVLQGRKEWKGKGSDIGPDDDNIKCNDDLLAKWFAEWAIVNLHSFRKFHIILGHAKDHPSAETTISTYEKAWGHIEAMTAEEAFIRYKVTEQNKLDQMETERRRKLKVNLPDKKAAAAKARKEEREAARMALEIRMQMFKDVDATDEEVTRAGRRLLRELGASEKEVEECRVDMDRVVGDRWWKDPVGEGEVVMKDVDMDEM